MFIPRRLRWIEDQFSNVDGIPFRMPVGSRNSPVMFAAFSIDPDQAQKMLPGRELHAFRLWKRGVMLIEVVNYFETPIGRYVEFCIGIVCTRGFRRSCRFLPALFTRWHGTGQFIYDLPVSTDISVKGGLGIWGMAKRRASLDYLVGKEWVSSQYDLDGQFVMRLDVRRGGRVWVPIRVRGVGYGAFRGMLTKSYVHLHGRSSLTLGKDSARLLIGDHPRMAPIKDLDVDPRPFFAGFMPNPRGWLDDHVETWFLTHEQPPARPPGFEEAIDIGLSQEWPNPPNRGRTDELMRERYPQTHSGSIVSER